MSGKGSGPIHVTATLDRKHPKLAAFVVIPAKAVAAWKLTATTTIEGTIDGHPLGRRSLVPWGDDRFFVELRKETLAALGKGPGDPVGLEIRIASAELPEELTKLLAAEPAAKTRWEKATPAQQRMLREEILTRKSAEARERLARKALLPDPAPRGERIAAGALRTVTLTIEGTKLPGRRCGPYSDVELGFVEKTGCAPATLVPADRKSVRFETSIEISAGEDGSPRFRGRAVNGPPMERFLYLTWVGRENGAAPAMFRRAKLRLDAIPAKTLEAARKSGELVASLGLTDHCGMPLCASVKPPAIEWSAGKPKRR